MSTRKHEHSSNRYSNLACKWNRTWRPCNPEGPALRSRFWASKRHANQQTHRCGQASWWWNRWHESNAGLHARTCPGKRAEREQTQDNHKVMAPKRRILRPSQSHRLAALQSTGARQRQARARILHSKQEVYTLTCDTKHVRLSTSQSIIPGSGGGHERQMNKHLIDLTTN